ncbi:MAG: DUF4367 domain-containing protein [Chloroflexi bacterium]|nr:DUF4367 domain-containing protein [Chloroflexota bacterium]
MADRSLSDGELEAVLRDVGGRIAYPAMPDHATRVRARITARPVAKRSWLYALAPALLTLLVIGLGAAAAEYISLHGVEIFRVAPSALPTRAPTPAPSASPTPPLGTPIGLADARAITTFRVIVPNDPLLGTPSAIFRRDGTSGPQISFVYVPSATLPASAETGIGALVTELKGSIEFQIFGKLIGPGTKLENVTVNGQKGVWLEGAPHAFFVTGPNGQFIEETLRLATNTLIWEDGGTVYRIEAKITRDQALAIATGMR